MLNLVCGLFLVRNPFELDADGVLVLLLVLIVETKENDVLVVILVMMGDSDEALVLLDTMVDHSDHRALV